MNKIPLFSAVILSFNSARYIEKCVTSLLAAFAAFEQPSEILIFDNGSVDNSRALVSVLVERYPDVVKALYADINLGTTVSRRAKGVDRIAFQYSGGPAGNPCCASFHSAPPCPQICS